MESRAASRRIGLLAKHLALPSCGGPALLEGAPCRLAALAAAWTCRGSAWMCSPGAWISKLVAKARQSGRPTGRRPRCRAEVPHPSGGKVVSAEEAAALVPDGAWVTASPGLLRCLLLFSPCAASMGLAGRFRGAPRSDSAAQQAAALGDPSSPGPARHERSALLPLPSAFL